MTLQLWWDHADRSAAEQMAIDLTMPAVASTHGVELLRLYQWQRDTLSLGAHEAARRTWDRDRLDQAGVRVVRRPTGGRGVWHAATDLTYAWAGWVGRLVEARRRYAELHQMLAHALATNGLASRIAGPPNGRADLAPGACFDLAIGGEVLVSGRKAIGSAQRIIGPIALQHGAIARSDHGELESRYMRRPRETARSSQELVWPAAAVIAATIVAEALGRGAIPAATDLIHLVEQTSRPAIARFDDPQWTWRR